MLVASPALRLVVVATAIVVFVMLPAVMLLLLVAVVVGLVADVVVILAVVKSMPVAAGLFGSELAFSLLIFLKTPFGPDHAFQEEKTSPCALE